MPFEACKIWYLHSNYIVCITDGLHYNFIKAILLVGVLWNSVSKYHVIVLVNGWDNSEVPCFEIKSNYWLFMSSFEKNETKLQISIEKKEISF